MPDPRVFQTAHCCPKLPTKFRWPRGPCSFLLYRRVLATVTGTVSFRRAGTVLRCGSGGPILEGVWARDLVTEL